MSLFLYCFSNNFLTFIYIFISYIFKIYYPLNYIFISFSLSSKVWAVSFPYLNVLWWSFHRLLIFTPRTRPVCFIGRLDLTCPLNQLAENRTSVTAAVKFLLIRFTHTIYTFTRLGNSQNLEMVHYMGIGDSS